MTDWVTLNENSGVGGVTIQAAVIPNTDDARTHTFTLKDAKGEIQKSLTISQATGETADLVFKNSFTTNNFAVDGWEVVTNKNATLSTDGGLYCNNTFLQYKNTKGYTWYDFSRIVMEFDCKQELLNTSSTKRIVSLAPNQYPDGTGFIYQGNNSCAIVLNNNSPVAGWISIYTTEYDWGTFGTWFHVTIELKPDFMSLKLNDYIKTFTRPKYDRFKTYDSIYFGSLDANLQQKNKGYIKNFVLKAYIT